MPRENEYNIFFTFCMYFAFVCLFQTNSKEDDKRCITADKQSYLLSLNVVLLNKIIS